MDTASIVQDADVNAEAILQDATEGELLTAKNEAFMKLFRDNMRYSLQLEMYIETFGIIVPMQSANRSQSKRAAKEESVFGRKEEVGQVAAQKWRMKEEEAHADYSHWYYLRYPPLIEDEDISKWRKSKASQLKENDKEEEESSVDELDNDTDTILHSVEDDTDCQRNTCQRPQRRPRLPLSPSLSSNHNIATCSAVKTPPVTSLAGNEDAHATLEINERDEQMADVSQTQATVASLIEDDDTQIAPETKKREDPIVDNIHSMNINADSVQPLGEEVIDSDMRVHSATG
ncbi:hypothetical protein EI94DRAFT_1699854 [Lactarius quietus]|nr:hypothetical protein EI94DRAFT_1699854 [Lactarius quietus]